MYSWSAFYIIIWSIDAILTYTVDEIYAMCFPYHHIHVISNGIHIIRKLLNYKSHYNIIAVQEMGWKDILLQQVISNKQVFANHFDGKSS